jgi:EAL domain-containing protein (putative c-di-GMP-specific phosphodiesterase class I)
LRWHRDDGLVSPAIFIPIVEELGLIHEFGLWVFEQVCRDLVRWRVEAGDFYASVNLSAVQIEDNRLPKKFANVLRRTGVDPRLLALEITETAVMQDLNTGTTVLSELRELGMELLGDDFGTGHASFKYLRNLPIDGVKVDQLFVGGLPSNVKDAAIVSAVAVLTRDLGVRVVAEGVETEEQREFLLAHGLSVMQGFLFSRPLPVAQFEREVFGDPLRRPAKAS